MEFRSTLLANALYDVPLTHLFAGDANILAQFCRMWGLLRKDSFQLKGFHYQEVFIGYLLRANLRKEEEFFVVVVVFLQLSMMQSGTEVKCIQINLTMCDNRGLNTS